jgi:hypothetical protein
MVVRLSAFRAGCPFYPLGIFMVLISVRLIQPNDNSEAGGLGKLKKSSGLITISTSDLSACSMVLQSYILPLKKGDTRNAEIPAVSLVPI